MKSRYNKKNITGIVVATLAVLSIIIVFSIFYAQWNSPNSRAVFNTGGSRGDTVRGHKICLTKRDTSGPQTLECAIGLRTERGDFALEDTTPDHKFISQLEAGGEFDVWGEFKKPENTVYVTVGSIIIDGVTKVDD